MRKVERAFGNNAITVTYPTAATQVNISLAEYALLRNLKDHKVTAIKFIRQQYGLDLYSAKQIVDAVHEAHSV